MPNLTPNPIDIYNTPYTCEIKKIITHNSAIKSFIVDYAPLGKPVEIKPGQFVMVRIFGVDEIPISTSKVGPGAKIELTVLNVGECTNAMFNLKVGDLISVRGPYGNHFTVNDDHIHLIVGGGVGTAPLMDLMRQLKDHERMCVYTGSQNEDLLLFEEYINNDVRDSIICTDDGSYGKKGFVSIPLEEKLKSLTDQGVDPSEITVYTCGPPPMIRSIYRLCKKYGVNIQASLEKFMRCAMGVCGMCTLQPTGQLVCKNGPIFGMDTLDNVNGFGK